MLGVDLVFDIQQGVAIVVVCSSRKRADEDLAMTWRQIDPEARHFFVVPRISILAMSTAHIHRFTGASS